jgi:hypothetical protein
MQIRSVSDDDLDIWTGCEIRTFGAPNGMEDAVAPAETLTDGDGTHVPWQPNEVDLARLAHGGTIWLTTLGGLPPHRIDVLGGHRA